MKVGIWIRSKNTIETGGGFSYYDKFIKLIDQYEFSEGIEVCFTGFFSKKKNSFQKEYISLNPFNGIDILSGVYQKNISIHADKFDLINALHIWMLKKGNVDVVFYPFQFFSTISNFPFIASNWDLGHRSTYAFPELSMNHVFENREEWYSNEIYKALMIFTESIAGQVELLNYTKLNPERIGVVPLFPGGVVDMQVDETSQKKYLERFNLSKKNFFFYPAQFWAHKNHYNLLLAFKELALEYPSMKLVLTGSDKGNKNYIEQTVSTLGLEDRIVFPGFIENECLYAFYKNATALVFPTFLGPTNMPLLEARKLNCAVVCSDLAGHHEMMGEGALYFNPSDYSSISIALRNILNDTLRNEIITKSINHIKKSPFSEEGALKALDHQLLQIKDVRNCWGKNDKIY